MHFHLLIDSHIHIYSHTHSTIITELGRLTNLVELRLEVNEFTTEIPTEFGSLVNLEVLRLWDSSQDDSNLLTGSLPCAALANLVKVESLLLNDNELSGTICTEFAQMSSLIELRLDENFLTGEVRILDSLNAVNTK